MSGPVWAITSYFDSTGRKTRLRNYREFRRRLQVPLVAVELSFNGLFDLTPDDADILVQVREGAILWQKERLLNLALRALPRSCDTVAWLDCDIILTSAEWAQKARCELDRCGLVQPFKRLYHVPPGYDGDIADVPRIQTPYHSIAYCFSNDKLPRETFQIAGASQHYRYAPGMAWVAKRSTLELHGFYDALIMGAGDKAMVSAAYGHSVDYAGAAKMNASARDHYFRWAQPFYKSIAGQVAHIEGDVLHLWHGDLVNRRYTNRYDLFAPFAFNPYADIALNKERVWCWSSDKPEMHEFVRAHFETAERPALGNDPGNIPRGLEA